MVKRFFRDSAIYLVPSVLSSGMSFVMFPFYAHRFTPREYGAFDLLTLTAMLVGWTVALEIYQGVGRYVAGERDADRVRSYASTALWFAVGAYAVFAAVIEALAVPASRALLGAGVHVALLRVAVPWMCVQGVLAIAQAQLRWQLRPVAFAVGAVINAVVTVIASGLLVFTAGLEVEGAVLGQLIGGAVSLAFVLLATRGTFTLHFNRRRCAEMLRFSTPLVPSSAGVFLNLYADRLVIQHIRTLADVGVYGVGYRLAMVVSLVLAGFQGAAIPLILARKDEPSTPDDLARIFRIFSALMLSAFVVLSILATPAIRLLAAARYQSAAEVVPFLIVSVAFANMYIFAPGLSIAKKTAPMATITGLAGIANLGLALLLVPPLGIVGAGVATASTSFAWFVALMALSQRQYGAPHHWLRLIGAFAAATAPVVLAALTLPNGRGSALDLGPLAGRAALAIAGVAMCTHLALGRNELGSACRTAGEGLVRIRERHRRPAARVG